MADARKLYETFDCKETGKRLDKMQPWELFESVMNLIENSENEELQQLGLIVARMCKIMENDMLTASKLN